ATRHTVTKQKWLNERQIKPADTLSICDRRLAVIAATHKVAVGHANFGNEAVGGRIATGNRKLTCWLLLNIDVNNHPVRSRTRLVGDLDHLKIIEVLQTPFGAVNQRPVIGVALSEIEFTADHIVARARIAANVDAFDIGACAFFHNERQIYGFGFEVTLTAWPNIGERVALSCRLNSHRLDTFFDEVGVVDTPGT